MKKLLDWLDHRTGVRKLTHEALYENIPGGSRWRYVWGSTLTFTFMIQVITGIFLWLAYSPSSQTAWESVYYIQYEMTGGWLLRGLHHYTAQAMNILLVLHLMQVVIDGAYKAPREVNFWFGIILLQLVMALSLTGYLLPWDQKGYWATKVATNIAAITPFIGPELQKLIIGGTDYGHHTLTRFFALHAGVLPGAVIALIGLHVYLFRRHGITAKEPKRAPDAKFWPDQVLKDAVACLAILAVILFFIVRHRLFDAHGHLGPELGAPADPSEPFSAARPEWYFLFLFELLKYFPGESEIIGAMILPGIVMTIVFLMPVIAKWKRGHQFNVYFLWVLIAGAGLLTWLAIKADNSNPTYVTAVNSAEWEAQRVRVLAKSPTGIPPLGAAQLLRDDPLTQGPKLFAKNCASCHRYDGHDGQGHHPKDAPSAADLKGFATREWLAGLMDPEKIDSPHYFGATKFKEGKMAKFIKREVPKFTDAQKEEMRKIVAAVSAEAGLKSQRDLEAREAQTIVEGRALFSGDIACSDCHRFRNQDEDATGPDLTGYGSRKWLIGIIGNPAHESYYGKRNDRMPAFGKDDILTEREIALLADWLRGDWYEPGQAAAKR
ncbi:MAG: cytochrome b N-terminal domain-containing protein [Verrucomicrobiota bacterium]